MKFLLLLPLLLLVQAASAVIQKKFWSKLRGAINGSESSSSDLDLAHLEPSKLSRQQLRCELKKSTKLLFDEPSKQKGRLRSKWGSCAVVSNSGVLLKHSHGQEIDKADLVIRFNFAPIDGFEQYVGTKEDFRFINDLVAKKMTYSCQFQRHCLPVKKGYAYVIVPIGHIGPELSRLHHDNPDLELYELNPNMLESFSDLLRRSYEWPRKASFQTNTTQERSSAALAQWEFRPTSGAMGMLVAMSLCDEVQGYGMAITPNAASGAYHYYEDAAKSVHLSLGPEKALWRRIASNTDTDIDAKDVVVIPGFAQMQCA